MNHDATPRVFGQTGNALREMEWIVRQWGERANLPLVADAYLYLGLLYQRTGREADAHETWRVGAALLPTDEALRRRATPDPTATP
jgi:hypothetical protein